MIDWKNSALVQMAEGYKKFLVANGARDVTYEIKEENGEVSFDFWFKPQEPIEYVRFNIPNVRPIDMKDIL